MQLTMQVKQGGKVIGTITRAVSEMSGWWKVRYKNRWYKVWGGIRTDHWIALDCP